MNDPMEDFWKDRCMKAADEREGYRDKFLASEQRGDAAEALLRATVIERDQLQARAADFEAAFHKLANRDFTDLVVTERAQGAEDMRERVAKYFDAWCGGQKDTLLPRQIASIIRKQPIEDTSDG